MKLLLDTCAFIRMTDETEAFPRRARELVEERRNELFLSIASIWEMTVKANLGKIRLSRAPTEMARRELERGNLRLLSIQLEHMDELSRLPPIHKDPFDRMLIAQARFDDLTIITSDSQIKRYPVATLWE